MSFFPRLWRRIGSYVWFTAAALAVGGLSALLGRSMNGLDGLIEPPLSPPSWVFPVVWTCLFILMGVSMAMVWRKGRGRPLQRSLILWSAQLIVNFFWPIIFFRLELRLFAFIWLIALLVLVLLMFRAFLRVSRPAAYLQIPYIIWLLFAGYLNLAVYLLNR